MDYLYFNFNGISSQKYNTYIVNNGEDLSFPSQPGFDNKIVSPLFQGTSYLAGVNKTARVFSFECWIDSANLNIVREIIKWLDVDKIGRLVFDFNPNFEYNVKVESISNWTHYALNEDETVNYSFSLSFVSIGDFESVHRIEYILNNTAIQELDNNDNVGNYTLNPYPLLIDNLAPIGVYDENKIKLFNYYDRAFWLNISINNPNFTINKNAQEYYKYSSSNIDTLYDLNSRYGFCKIGNVLAESLATTTLYTNLGSLGIAPGESSVIHTTVQNFVVNNPDPNIIILNNINFLTNYSSLTELYLVIQDGDYHIDLETTQEYGAILQIVGTDVFTKEQVLALTTALS